MHKNFGYSPKSQAGKSDYAALIMPKVEESLVFIDHSDEQ